MRPAVFLDKDGTLVRDVPYNVDPARIVLAPGAREGLALLRAAGYALVVASNQAGVARGLFAPEALDGVWTRLEELLKLSFDGVSFCPHHPDGSRPEYALECACRKPRPGLILRAARELNLDLARSWMVGDILNDVEAGSRAGCRTILLDNGNETEWRAGPHRTPTLRVPDLRAAARSILEYERSFHALHAAARP